MTLTDKAIPFWVWFTMGFSVVSMVIGISNFGMLAVTLITVKGIYIPLWLIPAIGIAVVGGCIWIGWFFIRYDIQNRITEYLNANSNPQINQIQSDLNAIKERMGIK